jgi:3'-5' exoribonuclease 1
MGAVNFTSSSIEEMTYQSLDILLRSLKYLLVVDLEATCWAQGSSQRQDMETIEFGAVLVEMETLEVLDSCSWFIRPRLHPQLSEFCIALTGITQADVERGIAFEQLYDELDAWLAPYRARIGWASWGDYDRRQLEADAARLNRRSPLDDVAHINVKKHFANRHKIKGTRPALRRALDLCGLQFEGHPHRDARNVARMLPWLLTRRLGEMQ